ncbi:MAG: VCBS repeat-containing protein [Planctomycetales bacterium]|nr:VCBS repeat-containing protein [Planctomycetales bacterium]
MDDVDSDRRLEWGTNVAKYFTTHLPKIVAVTLVMFTGWMARIPQTPTDESRALAERFQFSGSSLNDVQADDIAAAAPLLAPRLQHLTHYLTAFLPTGATLGDLDGNGFPDEACTTDGFSGKVWIHLLENKDRERSRFELRQPSSQDGENFLPTGSLAGDYDEDGRTDLLVYFWGRSPTIFLNRSQGATLSPAAFEQVDIVSPPERWYTQSMTTGDVDGDGRLDLVVANYFPDGAKILSDQSEGDTRMNKGFGSAFNGAVNRLLLASGPSGSAQFREQEGAFTYQQWTIAIAVVDLDGDLLPEVFMLNDHGRDRVYHNRSMPGRAEFVELVNTRDLTTPKSSTFGQDDYHAMGVDFGDIDRDGDLDWAVSNFGADELFHQSHFVWMNSGDRSLYAQARAPFTDQSERLGLSRTSGVPWDIRMVDFDNDGSLEVFRSIGFMRGRVNRMPEFLEMGLVNDLVFQFPEAWHKYGPDDSLVSGVKANTFCVARADGRYIDIGEDLGLIEPGPSRGVATGDVNGDGRIDFLVTNQRAPSTLYINQSNVGNFVGVETHLVYGAANPSSVTCVARDQPKPPGRPATGASMKFFLTNGDVVASHVDGGSGFGGKRHHAIHVGLGTEVTDGVDAEISWRDMRGKVHTQEVRLNLGWQTLLIGGDSPSDS